MADDRKKKHGGEAVLEFFWDSFELAADQTFSTTIRIKLTGWWEGGKPREVGVSVYQRGQEPPAGSAVRIQSGYGTFPLAGLLPGHHYLVVVYIGERLPVQKMIVVPELPKKPTKDEKKTADFKAKTKLVQAEKELEKAKQEEIPKPKKPTPVEEETTNIKSQTEQVKAEKELKDAEEALKKAKPPEPKRQIKVLHIYRRPARLEVVLQRIGQDGKPEEGEISSLDFEQGGIVFGDATGDLPFQIKNWGIVVVSLPYFEESRQVKFFLPDDTDVKATVEVPARERPTASPESKPAPMSPFQKGREAARRMFGKQNQPVMEDYHV